MNTVKNLNPELYKILKNFPRVDILVLKNIYSAQESVEKELQHNWRVYKVEVIEPHFKDMFIEDITQNPVYVFQENEADKEGWLLMEVDWFRIQNLLD